MNITTATRDDAPQLLALQHLAYQTEAARYDDSRLPPLLDTLDDLTARFPSRQFLKALDGTQIIGSVRAFQHDETCFVERLIVHPDYRRRGIGTALLREIEIRFPTARRFELFTGHKSENNLRLYQRLGYRPFREQPANDNVTLVFLEKEHPPLAIRLARLELVAATPELLQAEDDVAQLARHLAADVPRNWPPPLYDREARLHFLRVVSESPAAVGWTTWYVLVRQETGVPTLIGGVGAVGPPDDDGAILIGYSLLDQFHRQGYATEALQGFLAWADQDARLRRVVADTFPDLHASIRVLEKNGFVGCGAGAEAGSLRFERRPRRGSP
jgi:RimJ/RimL family protein N-acetyltransferase